MDIKIAFIGTSYFAVPILNNLIKKGFNVVCVLTQPDKPKGRGKKLSISPVKEEALKNNLKIFQPASKNDIFSILKDEQVDLAVIASYGMILNKDVTDNYLCLNIHPSVLPKYRGPSPIQTTLLNGDTETGITLMVTEEKLDAGDIIVQEKIKIEENDNSEGLTKKLAELGGVAAYKFIDKIKSEKIVKENIINRFGKKQNEAEATYTKKIQKEDGLIDWGKTSKDIHNLVRAMYPWPGAYTVVDGKRIKIIKTNIDKEEKLELIIVQPEGKKEMRYKDYLLGNPKII